MKKEKFVETENFKNEGIIKIKGIYHSEEEALTAVNSKLDGIKTSINVTLNKKVLLNCLLSEESSLNTILSLDEMVSLFSERNLIESIKHKYYAQEEINANIQLNPYAEQIGSTGKYIGAIKVNYTDEFKPLTEKCICVINNINHLEEY